MATEI